MDNLLKPIFGNLTKYVKYILAFLLFWFLWPIVKKWRSQQAALSETNQHEQSEHTVPTINIPNYSGYEPTITINTYQIAVGIYDAFYNNDWFGWTEDEQTAIRLALSVPKSLMNEVASKYAQKTDKGRSIYEDFQRFLKPEDFARVASHFA
jgi:hypothetical protein